MPSNEYYTFDEASKLDLDGTGVKVLDVHQLLARYKLRHPDISEYHLKALTVYELAKDIVDAEPKSSFFFDECPFVKSQGKLIKVFITKGVHFFSKFTFTKSFVFILQDYNMIENKNSYKSTHKFTNLISIL